MGDPQTQLQEDKDPMLILHSSYLDSAGDLHPDGDLGTGPCPLHLLRMCAGGHLWALRHPPVAGRMGSAPSPPLTPASLLPAGLRGWGFRSPKPPRIGGPSAAVAAGPGAVEDTQPRDRQRPEIDVSDLGSRNYGARTDFYCLVTEDDI